MTWKKAKECNSNACVEIKWVRAADCGTGTCVEVGADGDEILIRDSKNPDVAPLRFTRPEWTAFVAGAQAGEFDV